MAARNIVATLRNVLANEIEEKDEIWEVLTVLSKDPEPSVRTEFAEKISQLVLIALDSRLYDSSFLKKKILPLVGHALTDTNAQVRDFLLSLFVYILLLLCRFGKLVKLLLLSLLKIPFW